MNLSRSALSIAILTALSTSAIAENLAVQQSDKVENLDEISLSTIVVQAEKTDSVGQKTYTKEQLENMPNGKKTISEFLRQNPNVQFQRDSLSAKNQASLAPEKISINGAKFYDNKFVVNGVNTSNTFDPIGEDADASVNGVPSQAQTANINTDLLCELEVIDSNASAEHGDFQGGVISAKTCAPSTEIGKLHGSINADYTSSAWTRFNFIDEAERFEAEDELNSISSKQYHREYETYGISSSIYGNLNKNWGFSLNAAQRKSNIPVLSGFSLDKINTHEQNESLGLIAFYRPNENNKFKFGIDHFNYDRDGYFTNMIRSDYTIATTTSNFFVQSEHLFDKFKIENNLSYRSSDQIREHDQNFSTIWAYSKDDKNWMPEKNRGETTFTEGGVGGSINAQQSTFNYDFKITANPFKTYALTHNFKLGAGYIHNEADWDRYADHATYTGSGFEKTKDKNGKDTKTDNISKPKRGDLGNATCAVGDYLCSNASLEQAYKVDGKVADYLQWNGQYLKSGKIYKAGTVNARQDQWFTYIEDQISWNRFKLRLGTRADYESLASNFNIAPRSSLEFKPFDNPSLRLTSGFNRYYGTTYLYTELNDRTAAFTQNVVRADEYSSDWNASNNYGWTNVDDPSQISGTKATDLNTPYNDEIMFAFDGEISNLNWALKWVNRDYKDAIRKNQKTSSYENIDSGKANIYTFTLSNLSPYKFLNTQHHLNLGLSYIDDETYQPTYRANNSTTNDRWIWLNGESYQYGNLPVKDSPFTARLNWLIQSSNSTWALNNFFNYRSGSTNYVDSKKDIDIGNSIIADIYEEVNFPSKFTWDTRATYNWKLKQDQNIAFGLTVSNVLNKKNLAVDSNGTRYSEEGRRFIADISYKF